MLPSIALVSSVEMIRDGGSLAAIFQGANGSEYWLFFKVKICELPTGECERFGYEMPVVIERQTSQRFEISWDHAGVLLSQMRSMLHEDTDRQWLEAMHASGSVSGELPPGVDRFLGGSRRL